MANNKQLKIRRKTHERKQWSEFYMNVALVQIENPSNLFSVLVAFVKQNQRTEERNKRSIIFVIIIVVLPRCRLSRLSLCCHSDEALVRKKNLSNSKQQTMKQIHRKFSVSTQIIKNEFYWQWIWFTIAYNSKCVNFVLHVNFSSFREYRVTRQCNKKNKK